MIELGFGEPSKFKYRKKENLPRKKRKALVNRINGSRAEKVSPGDGKPQMNGKCIKWSSHVISPKVKPALTGG